MIYMEKSESHNTTRIAVVAVVPGLQVAAQEGGDEAVGVPEAQGLAAALDAAAHVAAHRGAADEGGRVGARRDLLDDVERERGRLVSPPPSSRCCLRRRPGNVAAARHCFWSTAIDRDLGPWKINEYIYSRTSRCLGP